MDPALILSLRAALAVLLAAASLHKLRDPVRFRAVLAAYDLVSPRTVTTLAAAIGPLEALLALGVAAGSRAAAVATAALVLTYATAIEANVRRGRRDIDCGCTGAAARVPLSRALVVRNLGLAAAALLLLLPAAPRELTWLDVATVITATATLSACWMASERLLALAPRAAALRARRRPS